MMSMATLRELLQRWSGALRGDDSSANTYICGSKVAVLQLEEEYRMYQQQLLEKSWRRHVSHSVSFSVKRRKGGYVCFVLIIISEVMVF
jgi:hypothetical protein